MTALPYHIPALLAPTVEALAIRPDGCYADMTFGGGGHSRAIMDALGADGHLYGFDQDADAAANRIDDRRFTFVHSNFRYLSNFMRYYGVSTLDGVLADLGVSFHHFDDAERGFSFRFDGQLDMRMNREAGLTAADVLNTYEEAQLADLFYLYGELRDARKIARAIVRQRQSAPLLTTRQLADLLQPYCSRDKEKKDLSRAFQALRMEVNHELDALREMLQAATRLLRPGGRLVIITYHSLEDRLVKNYFRAGNFEGRVEKDFYGNPLSPLRPLGKPVTPTEDEVAQNPRSRSAKLRVAERA